MMMNEKPKEISKESMIGISAVSEAIKKDREIAKLKEEISGFNVRFKRRETYIKELCDIKNKELALKDKALKDACDVISKNCSADCPLYFKACPSDCDDGCNKLPKFFIEEARKND